MDPSMTPEERWTQMENIIASILEGQAAFDAEMKAMATRQAEHEERHERDTAMINRAIVVLLESHGKLADAQREAAQTHAQAQKELALAQRETEKKISDLTDLMHEHEGKIEALIDTVDRIIRRDLPPPS